MEQIIRFLEKFFEVEAKVSSLKGKRDISAYNSCLEYYYSMMVEELRGATGYMPMTSMRSDDDYEKLMNYPDDNQRHLFKISEYKHDKYGRVWVAYVSAQNPRPEIKRLNNAIFVIEEQGYKVAKFILYTDYSENAELDSTFHWEEMWGYPDLMIGKMEGPLKIDRIEEPSSRNGGDELYRAKM